MPFTFRQLAIFVETAEVGNFRRSADRLGISQPGLSKQIRSLEQELDRTLFERRRGSAAILSEDGRAVLPVVREILAGLKKLEPSRSRIEPRRIRVVAGEYLLDHVIKPALADLYRHFPGTSFRFEVRDGASRIVEQMRDGPADIAIATGAKPPPGAEGVRLIGQVPCSLYASASLAARLGGDPDAIAQAPFILPTGAHAGSWVMDALARAGVRPRTIATQVQFGDVLADMVRQGLGIGVLFDDHVARLCPDELTRLPVAVEPAWRFMAVNERLRTTQAAPLLDFLAGLLVRPPAGA